LKVDFFIKKILLKQWGMNEGVKVKILGTKEKS